MIGDAIAPDADLGALRARIEAILERRPLYRELQHGALALAGAHVSGRVVVLDHPVVRHKTTLLRSVDTDMRLFRALVHEISLFVLYEATRLLPTEPYARADADGALRRRARAGLARSRSCRCCAPGLGMLDAALELLPHAPVGFVGVTRDEETLRPVPYYLKLPDGLTGRSVLVLDPMLATGGSAAHAIGLCREAGALDITLAALIAAPEGIARVRAEQPDAAPLRGGARRAPQRRRLHRARARGRRRPDVRDAVRRAALHRRCCSRAALLAPGGGLCRHRARDDDAELTRGAGGRAARRRDPARARCVRGRHDRGARRPAVPISRCTGEPGASIAGMTITGSQRIVVSGLARGSRRRPRALISVASSSNVTFRGLHVDGGAGGAGRGDGPGGHRHRRRHHRLDVPALLLAVLHPHVVARRRDPAQHLRRARRHRRRARLRRRRDPRQPHGSRPAARRRATTTTSSRSARAGPGRSTATGSACAPAARPRSGSIRSTAG